MKQAIPKEPVPSVEELARLQGVLPVKRLDEWLEQLSAGESEEDEMDLYALVMRLRQELHEAERGK